MLFRSAVTSGYIPLGGVMVGDRVAKVLIEQGGEFNHGYTYSGHPVCCTAALKNIEIIERENLLAHVADVGAYLEQRLQALGANVVRYKAPEELKLPPMLGRTYCEHSERGWLAARGCRALRDKHGFTPDVIFGHSGWGETLFLNEIFLPGKTTLSARDISAFTVHPENEHAVLEVKNGKKFAYRFRTTADEGLLKESHIGLAGTSYGLRWKYDKFRPLEKKQFPSHMFVSFEGGKKPVTATFDFSRLSTGSDWETHTDVPKKYDKVELQDLLKQLIKK